jgi:hypothetical protein
MRYGGRACHPRQRCVVLRSSPSCLPATLPDMPARVRRLRRVHPRDSGRMAADWRERMLTWQRCRGDAANGGCRASNLSRRMADMGPLPPATDVQRTPATQRLRTFVPNAWLSVSAKTSHSTRPQFTMPISLFLTCDLLLLQGGCRQKISRTNEMKGWKVREGLSRGGVHVCTRIHRSRPPMLGPYCLVSDPGNDASIQICGQSSNGSSLSPPSYGCNPSMHPRRRGCPNSAGRSSAANFYCGDPFGQFSVLGDWQCLRAAPKGWLARGSMRCQRSRLAWRGADRDIPDQEEPANMRAPRNCRHVAARPPSRCHGEPACVWHAMRQARDRASFGARSLLRGPFQRRLAITQAP